MNIQTPLPKSHQIWEQVRTKLDQNTPFSNMYDTPYYRDAVYDRVCVVCRAGEGVAYGLEAIMIARANQVL